MTYRNLTEDEVLRLKSQSCLADDWGKVTVAEEFSTEFVHHTRFSGEVRLGAGYHCHNLHGGYAGIAELCAKPRERIQHKEEASFCVSDPVPDSSNLSGKSPDHR